MIFHQLSPKNNPSIKVVDYRPSFHSISPVLLASNPSTLVAPVLKQDNPLRIPGVGYGSRARAPCVPQPVYATAVHILNWKLHDSVSIFIDTIDCVHELAKLAQ